jgi:hypothetical protein
MSADSGVPTQRSRYLPYVALGCILALAAFLRFHSIADRGFFFDELWIVQLSSGHGSAFMNMPVDTLLDQPNTVALPYARPVWEIPKNTTGAIHPPGTFVMLRLWRDLFGDSVVSVRGFSAAWSVIVVGLCFVAGRIAFNMRTGLWAALMSAVSIGNIDQAQDVRGYTMMQAELLLTVIVLLKLRGKPSSWPGATAIGVGTLAMMYTHYFAAGACAAIVFGIITLLGGRTRWQALASIAVAGVLWTITWLPHLRAQLALVPETADGFLLDHTEYPFWSTLQRLAASPYQALIGDPRVLHPITIVGGLVIFALLIVRVRRNDAEAKKVIRLWLAIIVGTLGILLALDISRQTKHLEFMKYYVLINPALCVLFGSLTLWRHWLMPTVISVALTVLLFTTPIAPKPDLRPQMAWLKDRVGPNDVVILPSYNLLGRDGQVSYLFLAYAVSRERQRVIIPVDKPKSEVLDMLPRDARWFYLAFAREYDPAIWLPGTEIIDRGPATQAAVYEVKRAEVPGSARWAPDSTHGP